jgi:hypothetical protein
MLPPASPRTPPPRFWFGLTRRGSRVQWFRCSVVQKLEGGGWVDLFKYAQSSRLEAGSSKILPHGSWLMVLPKIYSVITPLQVLSPATLVGGFGDF